MDPAAPLSVAQVDWSPWMLDEGEYCGQWLTSKVGPGVKCHASVKRKIMSIFFQVSCEHTCVTPVNTRVTFSPGSSMRDAGKGCSKGCPPAARRLRLVPEIRHG